MILLYSLLESYGSLVSSLIKGNKKLIVDEVLTTLLKTDNKKQLTSFAYGDRLVINEDLRGSLIIGKRKFRKIYM